MPDQQQSPVDSHTSHRVKCLGGIEVAGQRRMDRKPLALLGLPASGCQLRGLARAHLGAEQHSLESPLQPLDGNPRGVGLAFTPLGQAALGVLTDAVRLGLGVSK